MRFFPINAAPFVMGYNLRNNRTMILITGNYTTFCPVYAFSKMSELVFHSVSKPEVLGSLE